MNGKLVAGGLVAAGLVAGGLMYYLQVYAFYRDVPATGAGDVKLTTIAGGAPEAIPAMDFRAIDADSSPIRYRACFETPLSLAMLTETYVLYKDPKPLTGPGWFGCYNAGTITENLKSGAMLAFLGTRDIHYGIDRVVAIDGDGHGVVWQQINPCGEEVLNGKPPPEGCPPPPDEKR